MQAVPFAPYDALYREALTTSSPFYRLLCAWKIYEGAQRLRRWIREQCEQRQLNVRIPPDPTVNPDELVRMGFKPEFAAGIKHAGELFERLADARHAIAHFLIERDGADSHVYVADGPQIQEYAIGSAGLLRYAHRLLENLRLFCVNHVPMIQGTVMLPMVENRDQFIVRACDHGLE
jgi:hypothetical protein